jgi:NDP-sugar pyrophosphorylase family protein
MKIIIPMAGLGSRFQNASENNQEYKKPKPLINVKGKPMIEWATGSLPFFDEAGKIFIILKKHNEEHQIEEKLREIYGDTIDVVVLDEVTRGAAETVFKTKHLVDPEEDILISDSDHFFNGQILGEFIKNKTEDVEGIIPVYMATDNTPTHSYSLVHPGTTYIQKTAEKDRELMEAGAFANIGAYYFSKAKHFYDLAEEVIAKNQTFGVPGKGEFYIAPLYQMMIERGHKIQAAHSPEVWFLGTPSELETFLKETTYDVPRFQN